MLVLRRVEQRGCRGEQRDALFVGNAELEVYFVHNVQRSS